jgi:hypothetical protein
MIDQDVRAALRSCLESACAWRRCGNHLRTMAGAAHLRPHHRELLLREAEAADRQADWWLVGAIETS